MINDNVDDHKHTYTVVLNSDNKNDYHDLFEKVPI